MVFTTDMLKKPQRRGAQRVVDEFVQTRSQKIPAYSAAKASINNFTEWLAVHLAKVGIRVNAIAPGFFITNQNRFLVTDEKNRWLLAPRTKKLWIIRRWVNSENPEDLQGATLFLISDISNFITGIVIPVDGGYSAFGGV